MALTSAEVTVTTSATLLTAGASVGSRAGLVLYNCGPFPILLGTSTVTADTGVPLLPGQTRQWSQVNGETNEAMYGICKAGTARVRIMEGT